MQQNSFLVLEGSKYSLLTSYIKSFNFLCDKFLMYFRRFGNNSMYKMINFDVKRENTISHNPN